jgi:hypothetical protein
MEKLILTKQQIETILDKRLDKNFWFYQLGFYSEDAEDYKDKAFSNDYYNQGIEIWKKYKSKIAEKICDVDKKTPQNWINEILDGDVRKIVENLALVIVTSFSLEIGIAIALVALLLKFGIKYFCKNN